MIAYHVDRTSKLQVGQEINLQQNIKLDNLFQIYNHSFSQHGINFLNGSYNNASAIWEICLEFIRVNYFSQYPSRYQSFFGVKNINDAIFWKGYFSNSTNTKINICKIDFSSCFEFDVNWLSGISLASSPDNYQFSSSTIADFLHKSYKYWNQEKTDNPINELLIIPPVKIIDIIY